MLVQIEQEEYDNLIEQINMLQELVAELSKEKESEAFKPISEYTIDDWKQAQEDHWLFTTEGQNVVSVREVSHHRMQLRGGEKGTWWVNMPSGKDTDKIGYTVVERIK